MTRGELIFSLETGNSDSEQTTFCPLRPDQNDIPLYPCFLSLYQLSCVAFEVCQSRSPEARDFWTRNVSLTIFLTFQSRRCSRAGLTFGFPFCARLVFAYVQDFRKWYCKVCSVGERRSGREMFTMKAAKLHETSDGHKRRVQEHNSEWGLDNPWGTWKEGEFDDLWTIRSSERMTRVDSLKDFIPFWREQVEAANQGIELRFGKFLEALEEKEHSRADGAVEWNTEIPAWAIDDVIAAGGDGEEDEPKAQSYWRPAKFSSQTTSRDLRSHSGRTSQNVPTVHADAEDGRTPGSEDAFRFVEKVAQLRSASKDQKKVMHAFFKVSALQLSGDCITQRLRRYLRMKKSIVYRLLFAKYIL